MAAMTSLYRSHDGIARAGPGVRCRMRPMRLRPFVAALALGACSSFGAVYPPRPPATPGPPIADPAPSRVVAHVAMTRTGLQSALDDAIPKKGEGSFSL